MACISTCGSIGTNTKLLVEDSDTINCDPATFDANSERYEILAENLSYSDVTLGGNGLTGGIDPIITHLRPGTRIVSGQILMEVGPNELAKWLPRILGNAPTPATNPQQYTTDEVFDLRPFDVLVKRDLGAALYRNCAVSSAVLRGRSSIEGDEQIMQLGLNIIGFEEHDAQSLYPNPEPALPNTVRLYWLIGDGKLTLDTANPSPQVEYYFDAFNLMFNNFIVPQTRNFLRVTCMRARKREIKLQVSVPYTANSHDKLYINRFRGAGVLSFLGTKNLTGTSESTYQTVFTFPNLYQTRDTPETTGPDEIPLTVDLQAFRSGATEPIVITNAV